MYRSIPCRMAIIVKHYKVGYQITYISFVKICHNFADILLNNFGKAVMENTGLLLVQHFLKINHYCYNLCCVVKDYFRHSDPLIAIRCPHPVRLILQIRVNQNP
jgi:hypothetical protein